MLQSKAVFGNDRDAFRNIPTVETAGRKRFEDEQVEGALQEFLTHGFHVGIVVGDRQQASFLLSEGDNKEGEPWDRRVLAADLR